MELNMRFILLIFLLLLVSCLQKIPFEEQKIRQRLQQTEYKTEAWWSILDEAITNYPDEAYPYYRKGLAMVRDSNYTEGIPLMERAAQLDPFLYTNYTGYVKLTKTSDYAGAIQHFEEALTIGNHLDIIVPGSAYERMGMAYKEAGQPEKAIEILDQYIAEFGADGIDLYTFMYRGLAKMDIGENEAAIADFERILAKWSKCPEAYFHKGKALFALQKKGEACKQFKKALLYKNYIRGNPSGPYIDQLYVENIEKMYDLTCR